MGSVRGKRAQTAQPQQPNKRLKTSSHDEGAPSAEVDMLQMLPPELLLIIIGNLTPRECQPLRLTCKALRDLVNSTAADTLTVTNDMAQYIMLEQIKHCRSGTHVLSNGWVAQLLAKFPRIKKLDVKCSQSVLTLFSRHMVRDCLSSVPPGSVPLSRIFDLAENVKTNSRRHSAVLLCELLKFKVAQSLNSKPPGYDTMRQDVKQYVRADQLLTEHRIELQARVLELVDRVLTLKGHVDARAHEHYKYARDTLDDSLLALVSCLQPRHSKYAYQLLAKAADPAKAARGWRWLFYFLARQKQAEAAIEAYKVVDKQALAALSPTCLSELFRSLIDNEITTQPEPKLRAITSESGSWTKFLYRGNFSLTSTQSREGTLEKVAADLIGKDYLDTAVNVMNRFETDSTAMEIWVQLLGALGVVPGGEMPLVARDLHRVVTEQVAKASQLASQAQPARRVSCHVPLVELLVAEGHLEEAYLLVTNYPEQGALDKHLLRALTTAFALSDCPPAQLSAPACQLLHHVLQHRLRDVAARFELTTILVAAYAGRRELDKAVELASSLDAAAAAAMEVEGGGGGGAVEPVPAAAVGGDGGGGGGGGAAGAGGGGGGGEGAEAAAGGGAGGLAGQRMSSMWRGVAAAAIRQGDAAVLMTALPRVSTGWLLGQAGEECGPEEDVTAGQRNAAGDGGSGEAAVAAVAGPSRKAARLGGGAAAGAGPSGTTAAAAAGGGSSSAEPSTTALAAAAVAATYGPATVWQRVCGVLLRAGRRGELESALLQLLAERRRSVEGHAEQRTLLEATARAMVASGCAAEALALARRLGGDYSAGRGSGAEAAGGCCSGAGDGAAAAAARAANAAAAAAGARDEAGVSVVERRNAAESPSPAAVLQLSGVRPCWSMLNVVLEGLMAAGQLEVVLRELCAAGAAQAKAAAAANGGGGGGCCSGAVGGSSSGGGAAPMAGTAASGLVMPGAAGRLRQSLLTSVLTALVESGRSGEAVQLLRALRGGDSDGPLLAPPVPPAVQPLPSAAAVQRTTTVTGRVTRSGRAGAMTSRRGRGAAVASAEEDNEGGAGAAAAAAAAGGDMAGQGGGDPAGDRSSPDAGAYPQPQYSRLLLEGGDEEEAGRAAAAAAGAAAAGGNIAAGAASPRLSSGSGSGSAVAARAPSSSFQCALLSLVKALQKRTSGGGGSATASGSSAGGAAAGSGMGGAAAAAAGGGGSNGGSGVDLLSEWLEVCKAWPAGSVRDLQLDALARRAMDKGRDLEVALQAGWLLSEASPQELRFAYTHRDLAQKCIGAGMLEAAQACLLRIRPAHWEDVGDATARDLMRAIARTGDKAGAMQLAAAWIPAEDQRADFIKTLKAIRPSAGGGGGSRAGSSSRGSSRD